MDEDDVTIETDGREEGSSEEELEASESRADSKVTKLKKELEAAKAEKQEYLDGWQRSKADYVNALKRFDEERAAAREQGMAKALEALLPAFDSLERAKAAGEIPDSFASIAKLLESAFAGLGATPIVPSVGDAFDPAMHEALGQDATEDAAKDDTVTAVLENGWQTARQVIRPAKVRVAHFAGA
jgi:molecular chaperone GrpE